jgi:hypothetical protein
MKTTGVRATLIPFAMTSTVYVLVATGALHRDLLTWATATVMFAWAPLYVTLAAVLEYPKRYPKWFRLGFAITVLGWVLALWLNR